jgi:hypothetical protein
MRKEETMLRTSLIFSVAMIVVGCSSEPPPDFRTTSAEWEAEYNTDQNVFGLKYADKVVEVTGPLDSFSSRDGTDKIRFFSGVYLGVELLKPFPFDQIAPEQKLTVKGQYDRASMDLKNGVIVKVMPRSAPKATLSADELVKACLDAGDDFEKKWKDSTVLVTGKVISGVSEEFIAELNIEGPDGYVLQIVLPSEYGRRAKVNELVRGQTVQVLATIFDIDPEDKRMGFSGGWILNVKK